MQKKQQLLKSKILQQGHDPAKFYQYWESLNLQFQNVQYDKLQIIVQTYVSTLLKYQHQYQDQEFNDFQSSTHQNHTQTKANHTQTKTNNVYADFDWDLLIGKTNDKKNQQHQPKIQTKIILNLPKKLTENKSKIQKSSNAYKVKQQMTNKALKEQQTKDMKSQQKQDQVLQVQKSLRIKFKDLQSLSSQQRIKCLKLKQNILNHHKNVQITITKIQQQEDTSSLINKIWKANQYVYSIQTIGRNKNRSVGVSWMVNRKYADFQWLKNTLISFYPGLIVPPLPIPPKNKQKIIGHQNKLEHFLMDAYRCPQLRNSKYFQVFLSYGNFSDFEGFKKSTQTVSKPRQVSNILNMKGQVELLYGQGVQQFAKGMQQYLSKSSQHLNKVKNILNQIKQFYSSISSCYTRLSLVFSQMSQQSHQFSEQKCFPSLTQTYNQISSLIQKHSTFCLQQKSHIQTYMISHFSYQKDKLDNMQSIINKRNMFSQEVGKGRKEGMLTKLGGFFGEKMQNMDIPSYNQPKLIKQVGFYNAQMVTEIVRNVQLIVQAQVDHFSAYGISRIDSVDKLQKTWADIMVQLSKLNILP